MPSNWQRLGDHAATSPEAFTNLGSDFLERHAQFVVNRTSGLLHP